MYVGTRQRLLSAGFVAVVVVLWVCFVVVLFLGVVVFLFVCLFFVFVLFVFSD